MNDPAAPPRDDGSRPEPTHRSIDRIRIIEVMDLVPDIVTLVDAEGRFVHVNAAGQSLWGYTPAAMVGRFYLDFVVDEDRPQSTLSALRPSENVLSVSIRNRHRHRDGSVRHMAWISHWLASEGLFVSFGRDITAEQTMRETARDQQHLLEVAGRIARIAGWSVCFPSRQCEWSAGVYDLLDMPPEAMPGIESMLEHFPPAARATVYAAVERCRIEGVAFDLESEVVSAAGRRSDVRICGQRDANATPARTRVIGAIQDITEQKSAEREIKSLAYFDPLTGLGNRVLLVDALHRERADALAGAREAALLSVDIDAFKVFNDAIGHDHGDELLCLVAQRLQTTVNDGDLVARIGSDDFMVLMRGLTTEAGAAAKLAGRLAERICHALAAPFRVGDVDHILSVSIGVALLGQPPKLPDQLLREVDLSLVAAKVGGGHQVRFFDPSLQSAVNQRAAMEAELRKAISEVAFVIHYEPQVNLNGTVIGAEALLRWPDAPSPIAGPADFIPLAEKTGLIVPLGRFILQGVCEQLAAWAHSPAMAAIRLSVNISAREFRHPQFVTEMLRILRETGIRAEQLTMELTESVLLDDAEEASARMAQLRQHGVRLALDDFGTGYSSLAYLRKLPLDQIKLDRVFVTDVLRDPKAAAIARSILTLGVHLGLDVIAEGVESLEQQQWLEREGCQHFQGYHHARAMSADQFVAWHTARATSGS